MWLAKSFVYKKVDGSDASNHQGSRLNKFGSGHGRIQDFLEGEPE